MEICASCRKAIEGEMRSRCMRSDRCQCLEQEVKKAAQYMEARYGYVYAVNNTDEPETVIPL